MKRIPSVAALLMLSLVIAACGAESQAQGVYKDGSDTVAVQPVESTGFLSSSVEDFANKTPLIVEARMTGSNQNIAEVQPDPKAEGVLPGDGKDIYGAIDFDIVSVIKGDQKMKTVRIVYLSGKRDSDEKDKRIAYTYEGLKNFQLPDAKLRQARDVNAKTQFLFLQPSSLPVSGYELAHPNGVAEADTSGVLRFASVDGKPPVAEPGKPDIRKTIKDSDVRKLPNTVRQ